MPAVNGPYGILADYEQDVRRSRYAIQPQTLSEEDRRLLTRVENRANNELLFGLKYHVMRRCFMDLSFLNGFQHVFWSNKLHRIQQVPLTRGRSRITDNKVMPAVQMAVKVMTSNDDFTVRPKRNDFRARAEARNGDRAMHDLYRRKRWGRKLRKAARWCAATGNAFLRPYWNPHAGRQLEYYFDPSDMSIIPPEMLDDRLKEALKREGLYQSVPEGEIDISVHSPFEVYVPDTCEDVDDMQWYLISYRRSLNWIRTRWPQMGHYVEPEHFSAWERNSFEARILSMAGGAAETGFEGFAGALAYDDDKSAFVKIYVEPPSPDQPKGVYAVVAGGILLEKGDSPSYTFGFDGPDLVKLDFIERPGSFWSISLPENMISPQRELNAARGQVADIRKNVIKPKMLAPRGAALAKSAFYDVTAEIIEYDSKKGAPVWQPQPQIPPGLFTDAATMQESLRDLSMQHEAFTGQNPSGVRAGYAINLLRERDLEFYEPIVAGNSEEKGRLWGMVHQLMKRTWHAPRFIQELKENELVWSGWMSSEDFAEDAAVYVDPDSSMPRSKAAAQAFAEGMLQYGPNLQLFPPLLRSRILETLEIGDDQKVRDIFEADVRWAEYALDTMIGQPERGVPGQDMPVRPGIDDHLTIAQTVRAFQKTPYHESLPPDAKNRINQYAFGQEQMLVMALEMEGQFTGGGGAQQPAGQESPQQTQQNQQRQEATAQ